MSNILADVSYGVVSSADELFANNKRVKKAEMGADARRISFTTSDLENLGGSYDTVLCIDVMIHYPTEKVSPKLHCSPLYDGLSPEGVYGIA